MIWKTNFNRLKCDKCIAIKAFDPLETSILISVTRFGDFFALWATF